MTYFKSFVFDGKKSARKAYNKIEDSDIKFFLGYSGWESSQLENELKSNSWVVTNNVYNEKIIDKDYQTFWKEKMLEFGGEYSIWSNAPENPNYN